MRCGSSSCTSAGAFFLLLYSNVLRFGWRKRDDLRIIAGIPRQFGFRRLLVRVIRDRDPNLSVCFEKLLELDMEPVCNNDRVPKPVGRPDPKNRPAETFQHSLPNLVPVTSSRRGVVPRPVALDASEVAAGVVRVHDAEIHAETGYPDLGPNLPAFGAECTRHRFLEGAFGRAERTLIA